MQLYRCTSLDLSYQEMSFEYFAHGVGNFQPRQSQKILETDGIEACKIYILQHIAVLGSDFIVHKGGREYEKITRQTLQMYINCSIDIPARDGNSKHSFNAYKWFITYPYDIFRLTCTMDKPFTYCENDVYYLNQFKGLLFNDITPKVSEEGKKALSDVLWHVQHVLCSNNEAQYSYFMQWCASVISGKKPISAIYMKACQGLGKSYFVNLIGSRIIGDGYDTPNITCITGDFNGVLAGKMLCFFEDPKLDEYKWKTFYQGLKQHITDPFISVRRMYNEPLKMKNTCCYIMSSNSTNILALDTDDRRFCILDSDNRYQNNAEVMTRYHNAIHHPDVAYALYKYLIILSREPFNARDIPFTETKAELRQNSIKPIFIHIKEKYIKSQDGIDKMLSSELQNNWITSDYCKNKMKKLDINYALVELGFKPRRDNIKGGKRGDRSLTYYKVSRNELIKVFVKKGMINEYDDIDQEDIRKALADDDDADSAISQIFTRDKAELEMPPLLDVLPEAKQPNLTNQTNNDLSEAKSNDCFASSSKTDDDVLIITDDDGNEIAVDVSCSSETNDDYESDNELIDSDSIEINQTKTRTNLLGRGELINPILAHFTPDDKLGDGIYFDNMDDLISAI